MITWNRDCFLSHFKTKQQSFFRGVSAKTTDNLQTGINDWQVSGQYRDMSTNIQAHQG